MFYKNVDIYEEIEEERKSMTPAEGWRVCLYDSWGGNGDKLTSGARCNTEAEAIQKAEEFRAKGEIVYIFGEKDVEIESTNDNSSEKK